jgi:hypothetical protein
MRQQTLAENASEKHKKQKCKDTWYAELNQQDIGGESPLPEKA